MCSPRSRDSCSLFRREAAPPSRSRASIDRKVRLPISHLSFSRMGGTSSMSSKMPIQSVAASTSGRLVPPNANCWRRVSSRRSHAAPGYLLFPLTGNLVARPFDLTRLEFRGDPLPVFPLSESLQDWRGPIPVSASDTGRMTHVIFQFPPLQFQWVGRAGELQRLVGEPGAYQSFGLSPDSSRLAVARLGSGGGGLAIDVENGGLSRLTYGDTLYTDSPWVGDSQRLVTTRWRPQPQGVVQISRDSPELIISTSPPRTAPWTMSRRTSGMRCTKSMVRSF